MAVLKNNLKFLLFMAVIFLAACSELGIPSISDPEEGLTRVAEAVEAQLSSATEDPAVEEEGAIVAEGSAAGEAVDDTSSETAQVDEQSTPTEEPQPTATFTPAPSDTPEVRTHRNPGFRANSFAGKHPKRICRNGLVRWGI